MDTLFLSVRVLHVVLGATWLGMAVFVSLLLMPAMRDAGPDAGKVMAGLGKRRVDAVIASIAGMTVLTGLYLYWHYTDGFTPPATGSMGARVFGAGGVLGIIAAIIAGSVVGRNMKRAFALLKKIETADAAGKQALVSQIGQHRQKAAAGARIVMVLLLVTIVLMAMGHYV